MQNKTISILKLSQNEINAISGGASMSQLANWSSSFLGGKLCSKLPLTMFEKTVCFLAAKTVSNAIGKKVAENWNEEGKSLLVITTIAVIIAGKLFPYLR
jgi:F0F1-type ATP synthase assembly protein I